MDTSLFQSISNLIDKSQNILVLSHAKPDPDALGSSLAFYLAMKELGKQVTVVTNDPTKENMAFLPAMNTLQYTLGGTKDFIISLDTSKNSISKIKYNAEEGRVNIIITPKDGVFSANDVTFRAGKNQYDLIVAFDTGNVEYFGAIYDKNVQMFFDTPIINIDHHASNTDYGQLNLVVPTAASTTEILYEYLVFLEKKNNKKLISPDVATLLLAGLITDTGSFQHANTSPRALEVAANLLDLGGRQQEIIKHFFKTKKLSTLKLWGMILSKVQVDPLHRMVWSTINHEDFVESEAEPEETEGIIDDLLSNAPGAEIIFLIKQNPDYVSISTRSTANGIDVGKLCTENGGGGHPRAAGFKVPGRRPFDEVVSEVVKKVRDFQEKRLNIQPEDLQTVRVPVSSASENSKPQTEKAPEKPILASAPAPDAKPVEKKVTYLNFEAKAEAKPAEPAIPTPAPTLVAAETPKVAEPAPMAKAMEKPQNESLKSQVSSENPKNAEPMAVAPQMQAPVAEQKPAPAPAQRPVSVPTVNSNPGATAAIPNPKKRHRKRHHKAKVAGGAPAVKPPANPQA